MGLEVIIAFLLRNWKLVMFALLVVVIVAMGGYIKYQSGKIDNLKGKIFELKNTINNLTSKIQEQNDSIDKWKQEADVQKAKVKEANRKADERMKNLGKSIQEILTAKLPSKQEVEWANKQLEEILKEW